MLAPETLLHNRYRIVGPLGRGGMGAVYEASDGTFRRTVAVKECLIDDESLRRAFEREARLLNSLRHPALPVVTDYFVDGGAQFLVMDYVPGENLAETLARNGGPLPVERVLDWGDQILDALAYLHGHEPPVVHRDIKPQNLKVTPRGDVRLLDFGLSKGSAAEMSLATGGRSIQGYTPHYAPIEQIQGSGTSPRSDLYSLAATLYHLLTNVTPTDALTRAMNAVSRQPDPLKRADALNPLVPLPVALALERAMSQDPSERPPTASAMRATLRDARQTTVRQTSGLPPTVVAGATVPIAPTSGGARSDPAVTRRADTHPTDRTPPSAEPSGPNWIALAGVGVLVVGLLAAGAVLVAKYAGPILGQSARVEQPARNGNEQPAPPVNSAPNPSNVEIPSPPPAPTNTPVPTTTRISGGDMISKATHRVQPTYPPYARTANVEGKVVVEVVVSETGAVVSARALSGHPLLRDSAVSAARQWKFSPTLVAGAPATVTGTITFDYKR